jgi:hypothetical protein
MPSHLGKIYVSELSFHTSFDPALVTAVTQNEGDLVKIKGVVENSLRTLVMMKSRVIKTLVDTSIGAILLKVSC